MTHDPHHPDTPPAPPEPPKLDDDGPAQILPAFAPVPRASNRLDGWKPEVQRAFISALAETGSVTEACRRVGRAQRGAYFLRMHPEAGEFRAAWDAALDIAMRRIEDVLIHRAIHGVEEPHYYHGKLIGTRVRISDKLLMFLLRNRAPERFAGGRPRALSASDKTTFARLKKQWRAEWERERWAQDHEDEQKTFEEIDQFIDTMRNNREANMSPRARAAYAEAKRIEEEDGTDWMLDEDEAAEDAEFEELAAEEERAEDKPAAEKPVTGPRIRSLKDDGW